MSNEQNVLTEKFFLQDITNFSFNDISIESRTATKDDLFVLLNCNNPEAKRFVEDAVKAGVKMIALQANHTFDQNFFRKHLGCVFIISPNPRVFAAKLAYIKYQPLPEHIIAVTGTNGKSSVTSFVRQALELMGQKVVSIGTMGVEGVVNMSTNLTTPESVVLFKTLKKAKDCGANYAVLEASSHGIDQHRLDCLPISAAAFTNLTHDQLDYHKTIEEYWAVKKRLFQELMPASRYAVVNENSPYCPDLLQACQQRGHSVITYGAPSSNISLLAHQILPDWLQKITISVFKKIYHLTVATIGTFQLENIMCSIGLLLACGHSIENIMSVVPRLTNPAGRMNIIPWNRAYVVIDYAHNPDGLVKAIESIKQCKPQAKIITIFGCGGARDRVKRSLMGRIASDYSTMVIVTDDNPRNEDPAAIRSEILTAVSKGKAIEIPCRKAAIKYGISMLADSNNILLIAGKGPEHYCIENNQKRQTCTDAEIVAECLTEYT